MNKIRSGIGYDLHAVAPGCGLFIGGIRVDEHTRFVAHSDGDVLLHALMDSLLGAMGEPDIGQLFPDSDPRYRDVASSELLAPVVELLQRKGWEIINIDCVVVAEQPKLAPWKETIRRHVATLLGIPAEDFNLKAKTKEKLDAVGRGEAIECFCIAMIRAKME